jgi:hypothetical protein
LATTPHYKLAMMLHYKSAMTPQLLNDEQYNI